MSKRPNSIADICQQNPALQHIRQHAQLLDRVNHLFQQHIPAQFSAHCKLANINNSTAIIHTDNASYSSLLRFQAPTLCRHLSEILELDITTIEVKVRPAYHRFEKQSTNSLTLPSDAADALIQTADGMDNGPLKTALNKLAKRRRS